MVLPNSDLFDRTLEQLHRFGHFEQDILLDARSRLSPGHYSESRLGGDGYRALQLFSLDFEPLTLPVRVSNRALASGLQSSRRTESQDQSNATQKNLIA